MGGNTGRFGFLIITVLVLGSFLATEAQSQQPYNLDLNSYELNTAGMLEIYGSFGNTSTKIVKYVYIKVLAYNTVGDLMAPTYGDVFIKLTGPVIVNDKVLLNGGTGTYYQPTEKIEYVDVGVIGIEYMDGSKYEAGDNEPMVRIEKSRSESQQSTKLIALIAAGLIAVGTVVLIAI